MLLTPDKRIVDEEGGVESYVFAPFDYTTEIDLKVDFKECHYPSCPITLGILRVNRLVYSEAVSILYGCNVFSGYGAFIKRAFLDTIGPQNRSQIRRLCYQCTDGVLGSDHDHANQHIGFFYDGDTGLMIDHLASVTKMVGRNGLSDLPNLELIQLRFDCDASFYRYGTYLDDLPLLDAALRVQSIFRTFINMYWQEQTSFEDDDEVEEGWITVCKGPMRTQITLTLPTIKAPHGAIPMTNPIIRRLRDRDVLGCHPSTAGL